MSNTVTTLDKKPSEKKFLCLSFQLSWRVFSDTLLELCHPHWLDVFRHLQFRHRELYLESRIFSLFSGEVSALVLWFTLLSFTALETQRFQCTFLVLVSGLSVFH